MCSKLNQILKFDQTMNWTAMKYRQNRKRMKNDHKGKKKKKKKKSKSFDERGRKEGRKEY